MCISFVYGQMLIALQKTEAWKHQGIKYYAILHPDIWGEKEKPYYTGHILHDILYNTEMANIKKIKNIDTMFLRDYIHKSVNQKIMKC